VGEKSYEYLLERIDGEDVINLCSELIKFKSINPPGDELEVAGYVADILSKAGLAVDVISHAPTRASVVARLKGSGEVTPLLYSGHLDVVPVADEEWLHDPFGGEVADGKIWGRGASDMKGGDAAMITAALVLASSSFPLKGDLILAFTAGEETDCLGARELKRHHIPSPVQAIFISEPSENDVYIAEKGALWIEIKTHGRAAHSSKIEEGRNALMMMVPILSELEELVVPHKAHPLLGHFTRSINTIQAGTKTNTIPARCVVTADLRTVPGQDHDAILQQVENLIADVGQRMTIPDFHASVKVVNSRIPLETSPDVPVVRRFSEVVSRVTGRKPGLKGVGYYTDAVEFVPALNAPFIICGPGNPKLNHAANEWVEVEKLVDATKIYTLTAAELLTTDE